jgi:two-component system, OmpR family, KDP operon response regulator KdpE
VASYKLLIIEDDPDVRRGLGIRLCAKGYKVHFATDAATGISQAKQHHPDLIILDLGLPGDNGYAVLKALRESRKLASIPVIVLSAWNRYAHEEQVRNAGAKIFCQKPIDDDELLGRIQTLLIPMALEHTTQLDRTAHPSQVRHRRREDGNEDTNRRRR